MKTELALRHLLLRRIAHYRRHACASGDRSAEERLDALSRHLAIQSRADGGYDVSWQLEEAQGSLRVAGERFRFYRRRRASEGGVESDAIAAFNRGEADLLLREMAGPLASSLGAALDAAPFLVRIARGAWLTTLLACTMFLCDEAPPLECAHALLVVGVSYLAGEWLAGGLVAGGITGLSALVGAAHGGFSPAASSAPVTLGTTALLMALALLGAAERFRFRDSWGFVAGLAGVLPAFVAGVSGAPFLVACGVFAVLAPWLFPGAFAPRATSWVALGFGAGAIAFGACAWLETPALAAPLPAASAELPRWALDGVVVASGFLALIRWTTGTHRAAAPFFLPLFLFAHVAGAAWLEPSATPWTAWLPVGALLVAVLTGWSVPLLPRRAPRRAAPQAALAGR